VPPPLEPPGEKPHNFGAAEWAAKSGWHVVFLSTGGFPAETCHLPSILCHPPVVLYHPYWEVKYDRGRGRVGESDRACTAQGPVHTHQWPEMQLGPQTTPVAQPRLCHILQSSQSERPVSCTLSPVYSDKGHAQSHLC
jgi:hypothetical protein